MSSFSKPMFPVSYSTICEQALLERLLPEYAIPRPIDCTFLRQGLNDTYLVKTADDPSYILRIYRQGWRTLSDISYEMDALLHLVRNGAPVSVPLTGVDGELIRVLPAPEGHRYAVLFTHAAGRDLLLDNHDAFHLGQSLRCCIRRRGNLIACIPDRRSTGAISLIRRSRTLNQCWPAGGRIGTFSRVLRTD